MNVQQMIDIALLLVVILITALCCVKLVNEGLLRKFEGLHHRVYLGSSLMMILITVQTALNTFIFESGTIWFSVSAVLFVSFLALIFKSENFKLFSDRQKQADSKISLLDALKESVPVPMFLIKIEKETYKVHWHTKAIYPYCISNDIEGESLNLNAIPNLSDEWYKNLRLCFQERENQVFYENWKELDICWRFTLVKNGCLSVLVSLFDQTIVEDRVDSNWLEMLSMPLKGIIENEPNTASQSGIDSSVTDSILGVDKTVLFGNFRD